MNLMRMIFAALLSPAVLVLPHTGLARAASALSPSLESFVGRPAPSFATPEEAVEAFKTAMLSGDTAGIADLLGLDSKMLTSLDGIAEKVSELKDMTGQLVSIEAEGDRRIISIGRQVWPFPFPVVKNAKDGKWAFDTEAGIEEVANRRVGENELEAIETARLYVDAQREYASEDHDADGVLEYAQKLISSPGRTDGLYWPEDQGDGESPVGAGLSDAAFEKAAAGQGYFGYRFRILKRQGKRIAGGAYDYVINGNMIGGFALIAWPVDYGRTGVMTFMINQGGVLYEKDLGPDTAAIAKGIRSFNPGRSWKVVEN